MLAIAVLLFLVVRKLSHQHRASKQRLTLEKQRLDTAVNNMTQGLLLFDSTQRSSSATSDISKCTACRLTS